MNRSRVRTARRERNAIFEKVGGRVLYKYPWLWLHAHPGMTQFLMSQDFYLA